MKRGGGAAANKRRQAQPGQSSSGGKRKSTKAQDRSKSNIYKNMSIKILQHEKHTTWKGEKDLFLRLKKMMMRDYQTLAWVGGVPVFQDFTAY